MVEKQISGGYLLALIENALTRDIMMSILLNVIGDGFYPILMAKNEIVVEDDDFEDDILDSFDSIMQKPPEWCKDISLQAISYFGSVWRVKPDMAGIK